ncbi:MAG: DEAD/DEAH box helicase, partial [Christensenellaceae bacterium]|nr:DEAD/DEAH box helicase [Christensenellaceae bacterium]MEA5065659.1 DEAD/DEAH box helicase [Eubacteriales bacterium]MEA5069957.1 DEAD/DEAH box helicase [Christensenellaceae bacterium]
MTFDEMNLIAPLRAAVARVGYEVPTPIQEQTIPLVLEGRDVLGCAQTGTGKTAAFALPILQRLSRTMPKRESAHRRPIRALVLTPTRELAQQIYENFIAYGQRLQLNACVIFGGVKQYAQTEALRRGVDILVATPGRLCDLIGQGYIKLDSIEIFVLDEADRMLDMGFIHDVRRVIALLPARRQTLLFSATMPDEVEQLALSILDKPETVKVDPVTSTVDSIRQALYYVDKANKKLLLADILKRDEVDSALVFARTRHGADRVVREMERMGIQSRAIHGDKSQGARQEALNYFKSGKIKVLIATDIAARGIDIVGLSHVINYDLPNEPEAYIHRIGRTGRAGLAGDAISFCCIDEMKQLSAIEKLIRKRIPRLESPWPMEVLTPSEPQPRGPRPSKLAMDGQRARSARPAYSPRAAYAPNASRAPRATVSRDQGGRRSGRAGAPRTRRGG